MGQQQLLLVVLVSVIVGIATVVGLSVFGVSAASANRDAVRQDMLMIASAAQSWHLMPEMMGGGGNTFSGLTFHHINFPAKKFSSDGTIAVNLNGLYKLNVTPSSFTITAHPSSDPGYNASDGFSAAANNTLTATVTKGGISWATSGVEGSSP